MSFQFFLNYELSILESFNVEWSILRIISMKYSGSYRDLFQQINSKSNSCIFLLHFFTPEFHYSSINMYLHRFPIPVTNSTNPQLKNKEKKLKNGENISW